MRTIVINGFGKDFQDIPKNFTGKIIWKDIGAITYYKDGLRHREDGPAHQNYTEGSKLYCVNGELHRIGGPAVIFPDLEHYWIDGKQIEKEQHDLLVNMLKLKEMKI